MYSIEEWCSPPVFIMGMAWDGHYILCGLQTIRWNDSAIRAGDTPRRQIRLMRRDAGEDVDATDGNDYDMDDTPAYGQ